MSEHVATQTIGAYADFINTERLNDCAAKAAQIIETGKSSLEQQSINLSKALNSVAKIDEFIGSPQNILGRLSTKHGEIAENVQVNISNAKDLLHGLKSSYTFDGVGRTAPEDYLCRGIKVQSKFIAGTGKNLDHILNHMEKYPSFGRDGSFYHIPKDHFEEIIKIKNGEYSGELNSRSIKVILEKVHTIERESGKTFEEVVKPGVSKYSEVTQNAVHKTVEGHRNDILNENEKINENIKKETSGKLEENIEAHGPSLSEGLKVTGIGAVIGGSMKAGLATYFKCKSENKNISEFNFSDWKDIGIDFGKGALQGGFSGGALYALTNYTKLAAPLASSFVSAACGIFQIGKSYSSGNISAEEFIEQSQIVCFDAATVGLGAIVGQAIIPVPVIGALVGSLAAKYGVSLWKNTFNEESKELEKKLNAIYKKSLEKFDLALRKYIQKINDKFDELDLFVKGSFDFSLNAQLRLDNSIKLAESLDVSQECILKDDCEIDDFFLK